MLKYFSRELLLYVFVGGVAFLADFSLYFCLADIFHVDYLLANVIGFLVGLFVNYYLCLRFVFSYRKYKEDIRHEFVVFSLIGGATLFFGEILLYVFVEFLNVQIYHAKLIMTFVVFFANFFSRKIILFKR